MINKQQGIMTWQGAATQEVALAIAALPNSSNRQESVHGALRALKERLDLIQAFEPFNSQVVINSIRKVDYSRVDTISLCPDRITAVRVGPEGGVYVGTGWGSNNYVKAYNKLDGTWEQQHLGGCAGKVSFIQLLPDENMVTGDSNGWLVRRGRSEERNELQDISSGAGAISGIQLLDQSELLFGRHDKIIKIKLEFGNTIRREYPFAELYGPVESFEYLPDTSILYLTTQKEIYLYYDPSRTEKLPHIPGATHLKMSPNNQVFVTTETYLHCCSFQRDQDEINWKWKAEALAPLKESPNCMQLLQNDRLVYGSASGFVLMEKSKDGKWCDYDVVKTSTPVHCLQVLSDGRIVTGHEDGDIVFWDGRE